MCISAMPLAIFGLMSWLLVYARNSAHGAVPASQYQGLQSEPEGFRFARNSALGAVPASQYQGLQSEPEGEAIRP